MRLTGNMKNKLLLSNLRAITSSYKAFISLMCISLLGVGFFVGIKTTAPDMIYTFDNYYDDLNVYDVKITSTVGFSDNNIEEIKKIKEIKNTTLVYNKDRIIKINDSEFALKFIEITDDINKIEIIDGRKPKNKDEIVVEENLLIENNLNIGDYIDYNNQKLIIVGTVKSPLYFSVYRDSTTIGNGKIDYYAYSTSDFFNESDNSDLTNVNDLKEKMTLAFGSKYKIDLVHGKMASAAKELIMNEFLQNKVQILISTTVIEVGVDVPNATMMVIFNAERFGLSTLHQLRGRVGRSDLQSSCILISDNDTKRLEIMEKTNDGFEISEEDFKLRGHGDLFGTKQSGDMTFKIADLKRDYKILLQAREDSKEYLLNKENDANKLKLINSIIHS